jgi:hypothetical protein
MNIRVSQCLRHCRCGISRVQDTSDLDVSCVRVLRQRWLIPYYRSAVGDNARAVRDIKASAGCQTLLQVSMTQSALIQKGQMLIQVMNGYNLPSFLKESC